MQFKRRNISIANSIKEFQFHNHEKSFQCTYFHTFRQQIIDDGDDDVGRFLTIFKLQGAKGMRVVKIVCGNGGRLPVYGQGAEETVVPPHLQSHSIVVSIFFVRVDTTFYVLKCVEKRIQ